MQMTVEQIATEALGLPQEDRAELADRLVTSLDATPGGPLEKLWLAEAKRRRDDVRAGRVQPIPGEEALARVRRAFPR
jgi:putative addiction module component (TIGR02574 family)